MAGLLGVTNAVATVVATVLVLKILQTLWATVWEPLRLRRVMAQQGVKGPPFRFLVGHLPETRTFAQSFPDVLPLGDYATTMPTVTPQYAMYCPKYGKNFTYEFATKTRLVLRDPEMAKEVFVNNHKSLKRFSLEEMIIKHVVGVGLVGVVGEKWAIERRALAPFFHQDQLKGMVEVMVEATTMELQKWEKMVTEGGGVAEFDIEPQVHKISTRILSLTAFGGDYDKGEQISDLQNKIVGQLFKSLRNPLCLMIPNYWKIPTKGNRYMDDCNAKIDALLHEMMNGRKDAVANGKANSYGEDFLGLMLTAATNGWDMRSEAFNLASVFNNCKLFYFAGQETVATQIMYAMLLLAKHPMWQDRARQEVLRVLGKGKDWNSSTFIQLKVVGMIINETLRLFPGAASVARETTEDLQLKKLFIPKGLTIEVAISAMHHDKDYWGDDVGDFNPERFSKGVSNACSHPQAFLPFSLGPKNCIGNNFAIMESKIILAMVLQRFELAISPNYRHHPSSTLVTKPKFGMPLILKAL